MFEHVGVKYYDAFFAKLGDLLAPDGVALLHTIGRAYVPGATNPWTAKYISRWLHAGDERGPDRRSNVRASTSPMSKCCACTMPRRSRSGGRGSAGNWAKAAALYDERFCRMWEFYLAGAEMSFRYGRLVVFQFQLAKRLESLPLTRDYMLDFERTGRFAYRSRTGEAA